MRTGERKFGKVMLYWWEKETDKDSSPVSSSEPQLEAAASREHTAMRSPCKAGGQEQPMFKHREFPSMILEQLTKQLQVRILYTTGITCLSTVVQSTMRLSIEFYPKICITNNTPGLDFTFAAGPKANLLHLRDHILIDDIHVGVRDLDQCRDGDFGLLRGKP